MDYCNYYFIGLLISVYRVIYRYTTLFRSIDAKWKKSNWLSCILFIVLFPLSLPFAIWNWCFEAKERKNKNQADSSIGTVADRYDEGYKNGYDKGYETGYDNGCLDTEGEQESEDNKEAVI